jgi:lactoylglutathione lyase
MIRQIATVGVYVENQASAEKFWTDKIGFEVKSKKDMGNGYFWLEVGPIGAETALVVFPKQLMPAYGELKPSIVMKCDDIEGVCAGLKKRGVAFKDELAHLGWGKFASFLDEDGNEFGLRDY